MAVAKKQRADGATVYFAKYDGPDGKQRKEWIAEIPSGSSAKKHADADAKARLYANEQRKTVKAGEWKGTKQEVKRQRAAKTIKSALGEYVKHRGGKDHHRYAALAFERFFAGKLNRKNLAAINAADGAKFKVERSCKVGAETVRGNLIFARSLMRWAIKRKLASFDPFEEVKLPKAPTHRTHYLTHTQEADVLVQVKPWLRRVVLWCVETGMDRGEVCELRWSSIDLAAGTVFAPRSKTSVERTVHLTQRCRDVLDECDKVRDLTGRVFLDDDGDVLDNPGRVSLALKRAYKRAGIEHPKGGTVKVLRHTFGSRLAMAGWSDREIATAMGHADTRLVVRYAHLSPDHIGRKIGDLDRLRADAQVEADEGRRRILARQQFLNLDHPRSIS